MQTETIDLRVESFSGKNLLAEAKEPGIVGAKAALESFYFGFNHRSLELLESTWKSDALVQLNNPLGGIKRGIGDVHALYEKLVTGAISVTVRFTDALAYVTPQLIVFAGRELGSYRVGDQERPLDIRTTRIFSYEVSQGGWRQIHHHGSIDDPDALAGYQRAVSAPTRR